jgi:hypothetical protein
VAIGAVRQLNIPTLIPTVEPKLCLQIRENCAARAAVEFRGRSCTLSVQKFLQGFDKFTVAPGAWDLHTASSSKQIAEKHLSQC